MNTKIERENSLIQICLNTIVEMEEHRVKEKSLLYTLYNGKNESSENVYVFEITDPNELTYLYYLVISETIFMNLKKLNRFDYSFNEFPYNFNIMLNSCRPNDNNQLVDTSNSNTLTTISPNTPFADVKAKLNLIDENNPNFTIEVKYVGATSVLTSLKVVKGSDFYINKYLSYYLNDARLQIDYLTDVKKETEEKMKKMEEEKEEISKKYKQLQNTDKIELQKKENEYIIQLGQKENEYKEEMNKITQDYTNEKMEIVNKYNQQIDELKLSLDEITKKYNNLTTKNSDLELRYKNLESDFKIQKEELVRKRQENSQLMKENDELKVEQHQKDTNLDKTNITIESLNNRIKDLTLKIESNEREIKSNKELKQTIENNYIEEKEKNIILSEKYNVSLDEINKANEYLQEYNRRLKTQKEHNNILKDAFRKCNKTITELQSVIDSKDSEINTLKIVNNARETDMTIYKDKLREKEEEMVKNIEYVKNSNSTIEYLNKKITQLEAEIRNSKFGGSGIGGGGGFTGGNRDVTVFTPYQAKSYNYSADID